MIELVISSVFVDQRESYFLSIPDSASKELQKYLNSKRVPSSLLNFILYVRYQQELRRRGKRSWKLEVNWEDLAKIVRISKLSIQRKKGEVVKNLEKAMKAATELGYLKSWKFVNDKYCIMLAPPRTKGVIAYEGMKDNKQWAEEMIKTLPEVKGVQIGVTDEYLEVFSVTNAGRPRMIQLNDPQFREKAIETFEKYKQLKPA